MYSNFTGRIGNLTSYGSIRGSRSDADLMAQSREQLTMDMAKSDNSIFKRQKGCYLSQSRAISLFGIFLIALVAVGVITHYATKGDLSDITQKATGGGETNGQSSEGGKAVSQKVKDVRLPENLLPIYYKVELIPYVGPYEAKNFTIDGKVWIDVKCLKSTAKITIHSKNITIQEDKVKVYEIGEAETPITSTEEDKLKSFKTTKHEFDLQRDFYNVSLDGSLEEGKIYRMFIEFSALLDDSLGGFYRSKYTDLSTNETRYLGTTQFQATDARKAFPCFDEPALKAKFEVSLARRTNMSSIANMDLRVTEPVEGMDGWVWDHYNKSVPMSTYIVAFVVSDFHNRTSDPSLSTPVFRVWARKDAIEQAEYARDIGPRILTHYEKYFDIEFPLPKQDMIALPDFGAGAMENWGLITYRESAMLYDPKVSSDLNKVRAATVVAHELAHMWYGNLVTMKWWSDLWLNEGFASFVEYIGVDHVEPEWKILEQFVVDEVQHVFSLDALDSSHAIYIPVGHPDEIGEIFDSISYSKGASIIRMMNHFLTESVFRAGLANYLKKWRFNSTVQDDLWESLTEVAQFNGTLKDGLTVKDIMDTWTLKKGFPVVKVERNYESGQASFTQTKFQLVKNETAAQEYEEYKWWVPISYSSKTKNSDFQNTQPAFWLKSSEKTATHPVEVRKDDWIIVNSQETGYYRVNYDSRNWELIINQLKSNASEIHIINRAQLMDDALNLARAALIPYDVAFNVTNYLKDETEYLPWEAFLNNFHYISTMLSKSPSYGVYKTYMRELIRSEYLRLGYQEIENEPLLTRLHRVNVANLACTTDLKECIDSATTLFSTWMNSSSPNTMNPIPTNLRKLTYCVGIKKGGEKEWDFLWKRYQEGNVATEKSTILQALSCSKETWILNRYLSWSITSGSGIRRQDTGTVIRSVAVNDVGNYIAFNFVRDKWSKIKKHLGEGLFSIGGILKSIGSRLNSPFELTEMEKFKARYANDLGSATRAVDQTIESIGINIQWMEDNYNPIATWLGNAISARNAAESSTRNSEL